MILLGCGGPWGSASIIAAHITVFSQGIRALATVTAVNVKAAEIMAVRQCKSLVLPIRCAVRLQILALPLMLIVCMWSCVCVNGAGERRDHSKWGFRQSDHRAQRPLSSESVCTGASRRTICHCAVAFLATAGTPSIESAG